MGLMYERESAEERGKANPAGLALETINELDGSRLDDVRIRFDGIGTETTIPQPPPISVSVSVENLEIFRSAEVLARIVPCGGQIAKSARQCVYLSDGWNE